MIKTQGTDSTLEPAYFATVTSTKGGGSSSEIDKLKTAIEDLQQTVNGTAAEGYQDGLVEKVANLETALQEIEDLSLVSVYYNTTNNWNSQSDLISEKGSIYVYSDAKQYEGQYIPRIKIGNGTNLVKDLYFTDQDVIHALNNIVTVTEEEKAKWNNKVSCQVEAETLVFSTD